VALLHQSPAELTALFERVAPGVPVVLVARADTPGAIRSAFEGHGFNLVSRPVALDDLIAPVAIGVTAP